jgi:hypothetical protein
LQVTSTLGDGGQRRIQRRQPQPLGLGDVSRPHSRWRPGEVPLAQPEVHVLEVGGHRSGDRRLLDGLTPLVEAWRVKPPLRDLLP